jgi:hypothetical protein
VIWTDYPGYLEDWNPFVVRGIERKSYGNFGFWMPHTLGEYPQQAMVKSSRFLE